MSMTSTAPQNIISPKGFKKESAFNIMADYRDKIQSATQSFSERAMTSQTKVQSTQGILRNYLKGKGFNKTTESSTTKELDAAQIKHERRRTNNLIALKQMRSLEYNWNDNGADEFDEELINSVVSIVTFLEIQPYVFPTARQSIQLEYDKANGDYLELEIFKDRVEIYTELADGSDNERIIPLSDYKELERVVTEFHGSVY